MDLFVVNRYYGDETSSKFLLDKQSSSYEEESQINFESPESSKAKKKKKKDRDIDVTLDSSICTQNTETSFSLKMKKSKRNKSEVTQEDTAVLEDINSEEIVVHKSKKSKRDSTVNEPENIEGSVENSNKKKRKSKSNDVPAEENIADLNNTETEILESKNSKRKSAKHDLKLENEAIENVPLSKKKKVEPAEIVPEENNEINETSSKKKKRKSEKANTTFEDNHESIENVKVETPTKKRELENPCTNNEPAEIVPEENNEINETSSKKKKRKSEKANTTFEDNHESIENIKVETPTRKHKKRESENPCTNNEPAEVVPEENDELNETSSKKKKRKSEKANTTNVAQDEQKTESKEISQRPQKDALVKSDDSNENAVDSNEDKEEGKPDETTRKGKKRFRQRARYKDRPKTAQTQKEEEEKEENNAEDKEDGEEEKEKSRDLGGFQVIGNLEFQKKKKVKRVLPDWLANPTVISVNLNNLKHKVEDIEELDPYFKTQLRKNNVTHMFPVQSELIPFLIKQHSRRTMFWPGDICVSAPTGSGKTLAFVLPIIQLLQYRVVPRIRALVVLPTQDLASQVFSVFKTYVKGTKLQVVLTVGSTSILEEQKKLVNWDIVKQEHVSLVDIVVTTPGRLVDHLTNSPGFDLSGLKFLVVDEADRMIDNNDCNWLLHINKHINYQGLNAAPPLCIHTFLTYPSRAQRLLFSATLSHDPEKLHQLGLFQPKLFTSVVDATGVDNVPAVDPEDSAFIGKFTTPAELSEKLTVTRTMLKPLVVYQLIKKHDWKGVLCFVNTAQGAHRLARLLHLIEKVASKKDGSAPLNIAEVYSDLKFEQRNKIIQDFRRRKIHLVVASDNLARGIDVENIDVVINYEAPDNIKKYIHRIGRTARGGRQGTSVTLVTTHERNAFLKMLAGVGKHNVTDLECTEDELEKLEEVYSKALEFLKKDVEREGEMILKIAKAQRKGKVVKKKPMLLDGTNNSSKPNTRNFKIKKKKQLKKQNKSAKKMRF